MGLPMGPQGRQVGAHTAPYIMGLTESNQSKGGGGWGPSKSRSTPHFPDGRSYQNRPRQAATLPARPTPDSGHPPAYNHPRTPVHDPGSMGHDPRPPETPLRRRDGTSLAERSSGHRSMPPRRSASADSIKWRCDPLLDSATLKHIPQVKPLQVDSFALFPTPEPTVSPPSSPRQNSRPRPTAIYVADDQAAHLVRHREGRPRTRGHQARSPHSGTHGVPGEEGKERAVSSCERRPKGIHVSTLTLTPQYPRESAPRPEDQPRPTPRHHRRKKENKKTRPRVEYSASEGVQGDPYVCLHYGGTLDDGQRQQLQQATAWRTQHQEEKVSSNNQLSQVVIRMNQVSTTTLDNYDAVNANIESVQVRRNVWFHANRTTDVSTERAASRTKGINIPTVNDYVSVGDRSETEMIAWPDVTSKVSSIYMRPEMHVGAVSCIREGREAIYANINPAVNQASTSSGGASNPRSRDREGTKTKVSERQRVASPRCPPVTQFGVYDDRRNYAKAPSRKKNTSVLVPVGAQNKEEKLATLLAINSTRLELSSRIKGEPISDCVVVKHSRSHDESEDQPEDDSNCSPGNDQVDSLDCASNINTKGLSETSNSNNFDCFPERQHHNIDTRLSNTEGEDRDENARCLNNIHNVDNNLLTVNNHIEDYTIMGNNGDVSHYYGCEDSEMVNELSSGTRGENEFAAQERTGSGSVHEDLVCEEIHDNVASVCDSADKDHSGTDTQWCGINSSLCAWSGPEEVTGYSPSRVTDTLEGAAYIRTREAGESLLKDQCPLPFDSWHQKGVSGNVDETESRAYREALRVLEEKYWASTVPGLPSVSSSHQCLSKCSSLPRNLQCTCAAHSITAENKMKGFRNRFKSLDVSNFSVLRLPLGNQPRLVDVLRGSVSQGDACPNPPLGTVLGHEVHKRHSGEQSDSQCDSSCDGVTLVSYSQCCPSPLATAKETRVNSRGILAGGECEGVNSLEYDRVNSPECDGVSSPECDGVSSPECDDVTEGEPHLFLEDSEVTTIKKGAVGGVCESVDVLLGQPREEHPGGGSWKPGAESHQVNTVRSVAHTWHPRTVGQDLESCSTREDPQTPTELGKTTTDSAIIKEEDSFSRPVGRHVHKKFWSRPSVHSIAWDTPLPSTP
ncbi:hypothetical protein OTU49_011172, partial [Cherax quadricarinatus]